MINLEIENKIYKLPNQISEINIAQLNAVYGIFSNKTNEIAQWIKVISYLGNIKLNLVEDFPFTDLTKICELMFVDKIKDVVNEFEFNNKTYKTTEKISGKQASLIEKYTKTASFLDFAYIAAILFTEVNEDIDTRYSPERIKERSKELLEVKANIILPHITRCSENIATNLKNTFLNDSKKA